MHGHGLQLVVTVVISKATVFSVLRPQLLLLWNTGQAAEAYCSCVRASVWCV